MHDPKVLCECIVTKFLFYFICGRNLFQRSDCNELLHQLSGGRFEERIER